MKELFIIKKMFKMKRFIAILFMLLGTCGLYSTAIANMHMQHNTNQQGLYWGLSPESCNNPFSTGSPTTFHEALGNNDVSQDNIEVTICNQAKTVYATYIATMSALNLLKEYAVECKVTSAMGLGDFGKPSITVDLENYLISNWYCKFHIDFN